MQIAEGFHYAVQRLVGLVGSGSAPLIIHDGSRLSWLCPRVRRFLAFTFPRRFCLRFSQFPAGMCPAHSRPPPDKIVSRHSAHSWRNGRGTSRFDVGLVERISCTCRTEKEVPLSTRYREDIFSSSGISTSIYFYFIFFSRREALCQHHSKVRNRWAGQKPPLLSPSVAILDVGADSNSSPHPCHCIPPHLFTMFSLPVKSN